MSTPTLVTGGASGAVRDLLNAFFVRNTGVQTLTDAATIAFDVSKGANARVVLSASRILGNPVNARAGDSGILTIVQPAGGNALITWGSNWKHAGGTDRVLKTAADDADTFQWYTPDGIVFEITTPPGVAPYPILPINFINKTGGDFELRFLAAHNFQPGNTVRVLDTLAQFVGTWTIASVTTLNATVAAAVGGGDQAFAAGTAQRLT